ASEIVDRVPLDKLERPPVGASPRMFRLAEEHTIRGRVVDATVGAPVAGAAVQAVASPEDVISAGEAVTGEDGTFVLGGLGPKRYYLNVSKVGWHSSSTKNPVTS